MKWLMAMPLALVRACVIMLPRLDAEEALQTVQRVALAAGRVPDKEAAQITDGWLRDVGVVAAKAARVTPDGLASMGIGMQTVPAHG